MTPPPLKLFPKKTSVFGWSVTPILSSLKNTQFLMQARRLFCDSFVLSLRADEETVFCGLNNGCVQVHNILYIFLDFQYFNILYYILWTQQWLCEGAT